MWLVGAGPQLLHVLQRHQEGVRHQQAGPSASPVHDKREVTLVRLVRQLVTRVLCVARGHILQKLDLWWCSYLQ
jgi:hypothetical protein